MPQTHAISNPVQHPNHLNLYKGQVWVDTQQELVLAYSNHIELHQRVTSETRSYVAANHPALTGTVVSTSTLHKVRIME